MVPKPPVQLVRADPFHSAAALHFRLLMLAYVAALVAITDLLCSTNSSIDIAFVVLEVAPCVKLIFRGRTRQPLMDSLSILLTRPHDQLLPPRYRVESG